MAHVVKMGVIFWFSSYYFLGGNVASMKSMGGNKVVTEVIRQCRAFVHSSIGRSLYIYIRTTCDD